VTAVGLIGCGGIAQDVVAALRMTATPAFCGPRGDERCMHAAQRKCDHRDMNYE
jgi:hypothetical protein